jgi:hypothetical protein
MSVHVNVIDATRHQAFLKQQRKDPVMKEPFKHGDRVVICAICRSAFFEESWRAVGSIHCAQHDTLHAIEADAEHSRFTKPRAPDVNAQEKEQPQTQHVPFTKLGNKGAVEYDRPRPAPVAIRLREIPIQLRPALRLRDFA